MIRNQHAIETHELQAGYFGRSLCRPLDLSIETGRAVGIIGANGSGKSTVLRTIFDLQPPVAGRVVINGLPMDESSLDYRRQVCLLVEDGSFFDELTVREHLELTARGHRVAHWRQAVERELEFFDLQPVADLVPHQLSSGQRRKLVLAACLVRPARFICLDEPEQRLDPAFRQKLATRLRALRESGTGLVMASHDPVMNGCCAQRVLLLTEGAWAELSVAEAVQWLGGEH